MTDQSTAPLLLGTPAGNLRTLIINASGGYWHPSITTCEKILADMPRPADRFNEGLEKAEMTAYRICAQQGQRTLGAVVGASIRAMKEKDDE